MQLKCSSFCNFDVACVESEEKSTDYTTLEKGIACFILLLSPSSLPTFHCRLSPTKRNECSTLKCGYRVADNGVERPREPALKVWKAESSPLAAHLLLISARSVTVEQTKDQELKLPCRVLFLISFILPGHLLLLSPIKVARLYSTSCQTIPSYG